MVHKSLTISARDILKKKLLGMCQNKNTRARDPAKSISLIPSLFQVTCLLSCPLLLTADWHFYIVDLIHVVLLEATLWSSTKWYCNHEGIYKLYIVDTWNHRMLCIVLLITRWEKSHWLLIGCLLINSVILPQRGSDNKALSSDPIGPSCNV